MKNPMVEFKLKFKEWQEQINQAAEAEAESKKALLERIEALEKRIKRLEEKEG